MLVIAPYYIACGLRGPGWYMSDGVEAMGPYASADEARAAVEKRDADISAHAAAQCDGDHPEPRCADRECWRGRVGEVGYTSGQLDINLKADVPAEQYEHQELHRLAGQACVCTGTVCIKHLALAELHIRRPHVVVLCGSTRFRAEFEQANYEETMKGHIVLSVGFARDTAQRNEVLRYKDRGEDIGCTPAQKRALDELHKRKIDLADEVIVLNVGGYIGESTASEIEYAEQCGKPIRWLEQPRDLCPGCNRPVDPDMKLTRTAIDRESRRWHWRCWLRIAEGFGGPVRTCWQCNGPFKQGQLLAVDSQGRIIHGSCPSPAVQPVRVSLPVSTDLPGQGEGSGNDT